MHEIDGNKGLLRGLHRRCLSVRVGFLGAAGVSAFYV